MHMFFLVSCLTLLQNVLYLAAILCNFGVLHIFSMKMVFSSLLLIIFVILSWPLRREVNLDWNPEISFNKLFTFYYFKKSYLL